MPTRELTYLFSWANNCAANNQTNGVDYRMSGVSPDSGSPALARAALLDPSTHLNTVAGLSDTFLPTLSPTNGSTGDVKSFILPGNKTGVVRVLCCLWVPHIMMPFFCARGRCLLALF